MATILEAAYIKQSVSSVRWDEDILPRISPEIRALLTPVTGNTRLKVEEIKLRVQAPILLRCTDNDYYLAETGGVTKQITQAYVCSADQIQKTLILLSQGSFYALEEELQKGYVTIPGGHRVGFTGRGVLEKGLIRTLKNISSINIRIARVVTGSAAKVIKYLTSNGEFMHTLVLSPPRCGKTTILRDIVASLSDGSPWLPPQDVGLVDERSEIAGCRDGIPQLLVGHRTDVLDGCPKAEGMMMLVRTMAPQVIATDEIGRREDMQAMLEVLNAGIKVLATAHGKNLEEAIKRPYIREMIEHKLFDRYVILSRRCGPGTVEAIYDQNYNILMRG